MIQTVLGPIDEGDMGITLAHEHIMVGFIEDGRLKAEDYDRAEVEEVMLLYLERLKDAGCGTLVECTPEYLGRDPELLRSLSRKSGLHLLTNTGFYQKPYLAPSVYEMDEKEMGDIWIKEFQKGIGESGIKPGFIKIALNSGELLPLQKRILAAALRTSEETGLVIQAHTVGGEAILQAAEIIRGRGLDMERFIWVHADSEADLTYHRRVGEQGMWIELDAIGTRPYEDHCRILALLLELGFEDQILISQDAGWYNIGQERGGQVRPYHPLLTEFVPFAQNWWIREEIFRKLLVLNPAKAFSIRGI
jgi:phosphotriesterase-related protein